MFTKKVHFTLNLFKKILKIKNLKKFIKKTSNLEIYRVHIG